MLTLILTWTGAVLALSLLLIMALGPAIVEIDSRLHERDHKQRRAHRPAAAPSPRSPAPSPITSRPATDH